jgi:hypothetical protein
MSPDTFRPSDTQGGTEAIWRHQERLRVGAVGPEDGTDDDLYRHVFAVLREEATLLLPDDFAAKVAADAQRYACARAQVTRFRRLLVSLLSMFYLPAMLGVAIMYGADRVEFLVQGPIVEHSLALWLAVGLVLGLLVSAADGMSRKREAGLSD